MKIKVKATSTLNRRSIERRTHATAETSLYQAGAYLRTTARRSIRTSKKASRPGMPPHTRAGQIRRAILFAVDSKTLTAWVGPSATLISDIARYHETGGFQYKKSKRNEYQPGIRGPIDVGNGQARFAKLKTRKQVERARFIDRLIWPDSTLLKRRKYPARPFMGPAMEASIKRLSDILRVNLAPATSL